MLQALPDDLPASLVTGDSAGSEAEGGARLNRWAVPVEGAQQGSGKPISEWPWSALFVQQ